MATIQKKAIKKKQLRKVKKGAAKTKMSAKRKRSIEKAINFWETLQVDLSNFKFDREEANAR